MDRYRHQKTRRGAFNPHHGPTHADLHNLLNILQKMLDRLGYVPSRQRPRTHCVKCQTTIPAVPSNPKGALNMRVNYDHKEAPIFKTYEEFHKTVLRSFENISIILNTDGKVVFISRNVSPLLGHRPEDIVGKTLLNILLDEEKEEIAQKIILNLPLTKSVGSLIEFCCYIRKRNAALFSQDAYTYVDMYDRRDSYEYVKFILYLQDSYDEPFAIFRNYGRCRRNIWSSTPRLLREQRYYLVGTISVLRTRAESEQSAAIQPPVIVIDSDDDNNTQCLRLQKGRKWKKIQGKYQAENLNMESPESSSNEQSAAIQPPVIVIDSDDDNNTQCLRLQKGRKWKKIQGKYQAENLNMESPESSSNEQSAAIQPPVIVIDSDDDNNTQCLRLQKGRKWKKIQGKYQAENLNMESPESSSNEQSAAIQPPVIVIDSDDDNNTQCLRLQKGRKWKKIQGKYQAENLNMESPESSSNVEIVDVIPAPQQIPFELAQVRTPSRSSIYTTISIPTSTSIRSSGDFAAIESPLSTSTSGQDSMIEAKNGLDPVDMELEVDPEFLLSDSQEGETSPEHGECSDEDEKKPLEEAKGSKPKEHVIDEVPDASLDDDSCVTVEDTEVQKDPKIQELVVDQEQGHQKTVETSAKSPSPVAHPVHPVAVVEPMACTDLLSYAVAEPRRALNFQRPLLGERFSQLGGPRMMTQVYDLSTCLTFNEDPPSYREVEKEMAREQCVYELAQHIELLRDLPYEQPGAQEQMGQGQENQTYRPQEQVVTDVNDRGPLPFNLFGNGNSGHPRNETHRLWDDHVNHTSPVLHGPSTRSYQPTPVPHQPGAATHQTLAATNQPLTGTHHPSARSHYPSPRSHLCNSGYQRERATLCAHWPRKSPLFSP